jgi:hypothetical protein
MVALRLPRACAGLGPGGGASAASVSVTSRRLRDSRFKLDHRAVLAIAQKAVEFVWGAAR